MSVRTEDGVPLSVMLQNAETVKLVGPMAPASTPVSDTPFGRSGLAQVNSNAPMLSPDVAGDGGISGSGDGGGGGSGGGGGGAHSHDVEGRSGWGSHVQHSGSNRCEGQSIDGHGTALHPEPQDVREGALPQKSGGGSSSSGGDSGSSTNSSRSANSRSSGNSSGNSSSGSSTKAWQTLSVSALQVGDQVCRKML